MPTPAYEPPPRQFPWVACAVIGALAFAFLAVAGIVVCYFAFLRPSRRDEAVAKVKARPEVAAFLQTGPNPAATPRVELEQEDADGYLVHAYTELTQVPKGVPASVDFGWYRVSKATGEVTRVPPPWALEAAPPPRP
ncbi:MAG: hypothetical protein FJX75_07970 [Armatimonadetes bacterium]|nr:hypothetical protein [Armatimonadota bacterium]